MARRTRSTHADYTAKVSAAADIIATMSMDELRAAQDVIRHHWTRIQSEAAATFLPGDRVAFTTTRGIRVEGVVTKFNQKTVTVKGTGTFASHTWRCSPGILERLDKVAEVHATPNTIDAQPTSKAPAKGKKTEAEKKADRKRRREERARKAKS